jgi:hypothetical protein
MMTSPRRPSRSGNSGTLLALFGLMVLASGFLALTAMIVPAAFGFLAVLLGLFLFVSLHYLLWGWWLGKSKPVGDDEPRPEAAPSRSDATD